MPVRCFTCGAVIGDKWEEFAERISKNEDPKETLDNLGLKRYCCRRMLIANIEVIDEILKFYNKSKLAE
ncbi:MAG: DNA-directed RNA polymerase subunit N [Candidatus Bathyarchaeota archaeon]